MRDPPLVLMLEMMIILPRYTGYILIVAVRGGTERRLKYNQWKELLFKSS